MDQHRAIVLLGQRRFVGAAEVAAPFNRQAASLQRLHGVVVGDARERLLHAFELADIALEDLQLRPSFLEDARDHRHDQILGEVHHIVEAGIRHLRFDHPELGEVASRLRPSARNVGPNE